MIEETAEEIHRAFCNNTGFPDHLAGRLNLEQAYLAQFRLMRLLEADGKKVSGWKVGLTAKAMQRQQGMDEPCFGHLLVDGHVTSPARLSFAGLINPGFENELCLKLKQPLAGKNISYDEAVNAIGAVAPALEIIEKRSTFKADFPLAMAGNAQQRYYLTGAFHPFEPGMSLAKVCARVHVNDTLEETALGAEVLDDPVNSLIWLAAKLAEFDKSLQPGQHIMSGSFTRQYSLAANDRILTCFDPIGRVECIIE